ncbi:MAG: GNAT family N-acetyltransferase [Bacteroidota bacterium]
MKLEVIKAPKADKAVMKQLLEYYCYDWSPYLDTDVNAHGAFDYPFLDPYWLEENRHPFFIKADGEYAGFALVNQDFRALKDPQGHVMAEFFIMRRYRRHGIGEFAAKQVFALFPGPWEVSQIMMNEGAVRFWDKVIKEYTDGNFETRPLEMDHLKRQIMVFG